MKYDKIGEPKALLKLYIKAIIGAWKWGIPDFFWPPIIFELHWPNLQTHAYRSEKLLSSIFDF